MTGTKRLGRVVRAMAVGIYWLLAAVMAMGGLVLWARRRFLAGNRGPSTPDIAGFTIEGLERMLAEGQISPQEFAALRAEVLRRPAEGGTGGGWLSSAPPVRDDGTTGNQRG